MQIRKLLTKIALLVLLIISIYGVWYHSVNIAPHRFQISHQNYFSEKIPEAFTDFKIGYLSDFDLKTSEDLDYLEKCIYKLNNEECHMIIFGGDLFETKEIFDRDRLVSLLKSISANYGKFAVLGENELSGNLEDAIAILEEGGFEVMRNEAHNIYYNNAHIVLAGMENTGEVDALLTAEQKENFILATVHHPDYFDQAKEGSTSLMLAGHSGGGFINIPFIDGIVHYEGSTTYNRGTTTFNQATLMISNGIGMGHEQNVRFNCNPNALIITLHYREPVMQEKAS